MKYLILFFGIFFYSMTIKAQSDIRFEVFQIQSEYIDVLEKGFYGGRWIGLELRFFNPDSNEIKTFCIDANKINPFALIFNIPGNNRNKISNVRTADPFNYLVPVELLPQQVFIDTVYIPIQYPITSPVLAEMNYTLELFQEIDFVAVRNDVTLEYCITCTKDMKTTLILENVK